jgi:ABC-type multidrug transport system fused ATPase/permease subunit
MSGGGMPPSRGLFWWTLRRQWKWLLGGAAVGVVWRALVFALPVALGRAIDLAVVGNNLRLGLVWVAVVFFLALARAGTSAIRHWVADLGYYQTLVAFRHWILIQVQALDLRWHAGHQRGEVLSRINADPQFLALFVRSFATFASAAVTLVGVSLTLVPTSPSLGANCIHHDPAGRTHRHRHRPGRAAPRRRPAAVHSDHDGHTRRDAGRDRRGEGLGR